MTDNAEELAKINRSIPKELVRDLHAKKEMDTSQDEVVRDMLKRNKNSLSKDAKVKLERALEAGEFHTVSRDAHKETTEKIDKYLDGKIRYAMRTGKLDAKKKDAWTRRMETLQRKNEKK